MCIIYYNNNNNTIYIKLVIFIFIIKLMPDIINWLIQAFSLFTSYNLFSRAQTSKFPYISLISLIPIQWSLF